MSCTECLHYFDLFLDLAPDTGLFVGRNFLTCRRKFLTDIKINLDYFSLIYKINRAAKWLC